MSTPMTIAITVLVLALLLSAVLVRARGIGPLVSVGLVLGLAVGVTSTALIGGLV
jgi:hypothetical protein